MSYSLGNWTGPERRGKISTQRNGKRVFQGGRISWINANKWEHVAYESTFIWKNVIRGKTSQEFPGGSAG